MKQLLQDIIKNWQNQPLPTIKPRQVNLAAYFDPNIKKILSVVGFRRVGKTFSLLHFAGAYGQDRCIYINFEDERLPQKTATLTMLGDTIQELFGQQPLVLLLDEIQNIPGWSTWVRRVNETTPHHLIISGSSSKLSSRELPTELRGRSLTIEIFPLSWSEFLNFKNLNAATLTPPLLLNQLREYLFYGGLPEITLANAGLRPLILSEYLNTFVARDIIERYRLRNTEALRELVNLVLNSRVYTIGKITNTLKSLGHAVGKATIMKYLSWLESTFFLSSLELDTPSIKNRRQAAKKAYTVDTYFAHQFGPRFSDNIGQLMEQAVFLELKRRQAANQIERVFYWKDYADHEVDFVVHSQAAAKQLIQVSYLTAHSPPPPRETAALIKASRALASDNLTLITWDNKQTLRIDGHTIMCQPLGEWLLGK